MVRRSGGALVLGSATPSIEALYACAKDPWWHHVALSERANGKPLPQGGGRGHGAGVPCRVALHVLGAPSCVRSARSWRPAARRCCCSTSAGSRSSCCAGTAGSCRSARRAPPRSPTTSGAPFWRATTAATASPAPPVCPECGSPYLKKFGAGHPACGGRAARASGRPAGRWARTCPSCAWTPTPPRARARTSACWSSSRQPTPPCCWARR